MQQELRFATFNVCNLALPGVKYYEDQLPYTIEQYAAKTSWIAQQLDRLDADVIGFQEIFSQAALKDVLAKTQKYRDAHHAGFDTDPLAPPTPSVALVSRLPLAAAAMSHGELPRHLFVHLPGADQALTRFTRPILHAQVVLPSQQQVHVYVCHLKSKRPDYRNEAVASDAYQHGVAQLRSLIRRGTDALGLRYLLNEHMSVDPAPVVVMGDFNDIAGAVTTQLVVGAGRQGANGLGERLFESDRIQTRRDALRDVGYTHRHESNFETVDHILVSEAFHRASPSAIGEVLEVIYINDHLGLKVPEASDHGLVLARIGLLAAT